MENPLIGLGINKAMVEKYYEENKQELSLEVRIKEMMKDVETRWTTFSQYVTVQNLFLVRETPLDLSPTLLHITP